MRKVYITFGGRTYDSVAEIQVTNGPKLGADEVWVYDDKWLLGTEFYQQNRWLWEHKGPGNPNGGRGFGWFAWKPFICLHALSKLQPGDVIVYTDGDTYPIANFSVLFDECQRNNGSMLFSAVGCTNRHWCKRDTFIVMAQDEPRYVDCQHVVGRFMAFQNGPWRVQQFLMEWLTYCCNPKATTFDASVLAPEHEGFREARTEQAILTLLAHKYGQRIYREACQFGATQREDQDLYPQLFFQRGCPGSKDAIGSAFFHVPGEVR